MVTRWEEMKRQTRTIPEAAKLLGIGRGSAYEAARTGQLPTIRIGRRLLVPVVALQKILDQDSDAPTSDEVDR
jgi:excisionase family DNA binding protein